MSFSRPRVHLTPNIVMLWWALPSQYQYIDTFELLNMLRAMRTAWCMYFNPQVGFVQTKSGYVDKVTLPNETTLAARKHMAEHKMIPQLDFSGLKTLDDLDRETQKALGEFWALIQKKASMYESWPTEPVDDFVGEFPRPYDRCRFFLEFETALLRYTSDLTRVEFVENLADDAAMNWYVRCMEWLALKVLLIGTWIEKRRAGTPIPDARERFESMVEVTPYYGVEHPIFSGIQESKSTFGNDARDKQLMEMRAIYDKAHGTAKTVKKRQRVNV